MVHRPITQDWGQLMLVTTASYTLTEPEPGFYEYTCACHGWTTGAFAGVDQVERWAEEQHREAIHACESLTLLAW